MNDNRSGSGRLPGRPAARLAACFFLAAGVACFAAYFTACSDLGGPMGWATYTIVYHANDGSGGVVSTTHRHGDTHNLWTGAFNRIGYTFEGWSRDPHWADDPYRDPNELPEFAGGASVTRLAARVDDVINLFAVWAPYTFTVIYHANGGTGGDNGVLEIEYTFYAGARLSPNPFLPPPGLPYFGGWATSPAGPPEFGYDEFDLPELLKNLPLENGGYITLYAQWVATPGFTVTFNFNGGEDAEGSYIATERNEPAGRLMWLPNQYGLPNPPLSKPSHHFIGWNTNAYGSGYSFIAGDRFIPITDITLYAQWIPMGTTFTVSFNANSAGGTPPSPRHVDTGNPDTELPGPGYLSRPGYNFVGWSSHATGPGVIFPVGYMFRPTADTTLYARWNPVDIPWFAVAAGVPTTTSINFIFASPVPGLTAGNITVTDGTGAVTTGDLTMAPDGRSGVLAVTDVTAPGYVTVSIVSPGVASGAQSVEVFSYEITVPDIPWAAVASGFPSTTTINFAFAAPVPGLVTNDITVAGGTGAVTTGALTMAIDGRSGSLAVTAITTPGSVYVSINIPGIVAGSQAVEVFNHEIAMPDIPWAAVAIGVPYTTYISFAFAAPVIGLVTNDITVVDGTGAVTTGALTMATDGQSGSLAVTAITTPGSVSVSINRPGIAAGSQMVEVFNHEIPVPDIPWAAVAVGVPYTTSISFAFAVPVPDLATSDITVVAGAGEVTTGALTMAADGRSGLLAVTAITTPGSVTVTIIRPGVASEPHTVEILDYEIPVPDIPWAAVAVGVPYTTSISFAFAVPVPYLAASDITIVAGTGAVTPGALTMAADGRSGSLAVTAVTAPGSVYVSITRQGIADGPHTVEVIGYVPLITWAANAVGSPTTTAINFTFSAPVEGLTESDITIVGGTGVVTTGDLSGSGTSRSLAVTSVSSPGSVFVLINGPGVASGPQMVEVVSPHSGDFTISFANFQDAAPEITGPTFSLLGAPRTVTVLGLFHSVEWWQGGSLVATGNTLILNSNIHHNRTGQHHVTVIVRVDRGGEIVPYSRIVRFWVELN